MQILNNNMHLSILVNICHNCGIYNSKLLYTKSNRQHKVIILTCCRLLGVAIHWLGWGCGLNARVRGRRLRHVDLLGCKRQHNTIVNPLISMFLFYSYLIQRTHILSKYSLKSNVSNFIIHTSKSFSLLLGYLKYMYSYLEEMTKIINILRMKFGLEFL